LEQAIKLEPFTPPQRKVTGSLSAPVLQMFPVTDAAALRVKVQLLVPEQPPPVQIMFE
jgi:hypothetical protein